MAARFLRSAYVPLILAALVLLFMLPFLRLPTGSEALDGHDLVNQQYPLYSLIFDSIRNGDGLPLWNPYQFGGQSIVSNPQSTIFYPPAWIMLPMGVTRGVGWLFVLHIWWGGWGMVVFMRRLGSTQVGALAGGIIFSFSGVMAAHLNAGHLNYVMCSAWLPWMAAAYLWGVGRREWILATLPGAAAVDLCILTGHPPMLYFGALWLTVMAVYVVWTRFASPVHAIRFLLAMLIIGGILGAALLLPVADFTLRSTRTSDASLGFSNSYSLPAGQLLTLAFPNLFGEPNNGYWGVPFYEELTVYVGVLPLMALFLIRRRAATILLTIFVVGGIVVSLGIEGGVFSILYSLLPGYSLFRVPSRALYFVTVGGAGLAALLITDLQTATQDERKKLLRRALWILPIIAGLCLMLVFVVMAMFNVEGASGNPPWRVYHTANVAALTALAIMAVWLALRLWTLEWISVRWALIVTIAVLLIDVWRIAAPLVTVRAVDVPEMWKVMERAAPSSPDYRVITVPNDITWQAGAAYTHHLNASGYDPLVSDAYQQLLDASDYNPASPIAWLLGVRYAISNQPIEQPGLSLITQEGDWGVYETADVLPRAFVAYDAQVIADDATVRTALAAGEVDVLTTAIVDKAVDCTQNPSSVTADVEMISYTPNVVTIRVNTEQPGILVLTDSYDPNWTVMVDDTPADLLRTYMALRGVCVSVGEHMVQFAYQPRIFYVGVIISVIGWLGLGIVALVMLIRRQRVKGASPIGTD
jgi:hypothetical protein